MSRRLRRLETRAEMGQSSRPAGFGGLRVVIAGAGVAGLEAMLALRALAGDLVDVEVLAPEHHFWYRPLSVAEPFGLAKAHRFEVADLVGSAGATFTPGALVAVEPERRVVQTSTGAELAYDALVLACGTRSTPAVDGALTFRGPSDVERFQALLEELEAGAVERLAFAVPSGARWPLPLYELALLTAAHLEARGSHGVELALVTHEPAPLALLGSRGSEEVERLLAERLVRVHAGVRPEAFVGGRLEVAGGRALAADRVVALARLEGQQVEGIPHDRNGFVATRLNGRLAGLDDVYAAGDMTRFGVRQGGIASQQADAVAAAIAVRAGADVEPSTFEPVLEALLLTGGDPLYLRAELGGDDPAWAVSTEPLWTPPAKIAGRHLAPYLAERLPAPGRRAGAGARPRR
jgi:sulfide:quinone oxidoreductase